MAIETERRFLKGKIRFSGTLRDRVHLQNRGQFSEEIESVSAEAQADNAAKVYIVGRDNSLLIRALVGEEINDFNLTDGKNLRIKYGKKPEDHEITADMLPEGLPWVFGPETCDVFRNTR